MFFPYRHSLVGESITVTQAAKRAGVSESAVRTWAKSAPLSYKVGGIVRINRVALWLFLSKDQAGLDAFVREDFWHPSVRAAYRAEGLSLPSDVASRVEQTP